LMSQILWERGKRSEAWELLRVAACLDERSEYRSANYFRVGRQLNRQEEALEFLRARNQRLGASHFAAAQTLAEAYEHLSREQEALGVLKESMESHPENGALKLYVAEFLGRFGKHDQARDLLQSAEGKCRPQEWHQTAAKLANYRFDLAESLTAAQKVLEITPLDGEANGLVVKLLHDLHGPAAAVDHLRAQLKPFPHHARFRAQLIDLLDRNDSETLERELSAFSKLHPDNPWALRETALLQLRQRRLEDALQNANQANALDPTAPGCQYVLGLVCEAAGQRETSKKCFRNAIRLSVDFEPAIHRLLAACKTKQEREVALGFVYEQLTTQTLVGDGLISFRELAASTYSADKLLSILHQAMQDRPDLWHAWSALITQLIQMDRTQDAVKIAKAAVERFPLLPRMHVDAAEAHRAHGNQEERIRSLDRALTINGGYGAALRSLADAQLDAGNPRGALTALKRAISREPQEITHQGELANLYWKTGNRDAAIRHMRQAIRREPDYEWGWRQLQQWAEVTKRPEVVSQLASLITKDRAESANAWKLQADILSEFPDRFEHALQSVRKAIELDPRHVGAHSLHAQLLAQRGVFDKAIEACQPAGFARDRPLALMAREAEIEARRGNLGQAINKMKDVVRQDPDHGFAWSCLANWYRTENRVADYVTAASQLTRVSPDVGMSWGYLGHAKMLANKREEAKQCFARAIDLDPTDQYTSQSLQSMQIEDGEFDAAWQTLQRTAPHLTDEQRLSQEICILVLARKLEKAQQQFRRLCRAKLDDAQSLMEAMDQLLPMGAAGAVKSDLADAIQDDQASPYVAAAWVELMAREVRLTTIEQLAKEGACSKEKWSALTAHYLNILTESRAESRLHGFVERFRPIIRASNQAWSAVGSAFKDLDQCEETIEWMSDWQSRPGVNGKDLFP
ncbi:MAG: tetratricopeptide repeat protein, partial [Planctomycetota bacterium]